MGSLRMGGLAAQLFRSSMGVGKSAQQGHPRDVRRRTRVMADVGRQKGIKNQSNSCTTHGREIASDGELKRPAGRIYRGLLQCETLAFEPRLPIPGRVRTKHMFAVKCPRNRVKISAQQRSRRWVPVARCAPAPGQCERSVAVRE